MVIQELTQPHLQKFKDTEMLLHYLLVTRLKHLLNFRLVFRFAQKPFHKGCFPALNVNA